MPQPPLSQPPNSQPPNSQDDGAQLHYRIEMSSTVRGAARVHLPGRVYDLEALRVGTESWSVSVSDRVARNSGVVELRAANANDAVWRVGRAAARAYAELSGRPLQQRLNEAMAEDGGGG